MRRDKAGKKSKQHAKFFFGYIDDIVRTLKGDHEEVLRARNLPHQIYSSQ